ncbi:MAG: glycosyltransferase [Vicinamibacterales bacterium]
MTAVSLSVVVPVLNEESCIDEFLERVSGVLASRTPAWEIVVVDDGSVDRTVSYVERWIQREPRIQLVRQPHRGKGAAIHRGMLAARGDWRLMADADLSVAPEDWSVFFDTAIGPHAPDVIIGSREAPGSRRIGESLSRHLIGRAFNIVVQLVAMPGINDTQCGFKMLRAEAARALMPHVRIQGFAFDVELLFLARLAGFTIREVGVVWVCRRDTRVRLARGAAAFVDVGRICLRQMSGRYRHVMSPEQRRTTGEDRASPG